MFSMKKLKLIFWSETEPFFMWQFAFRDITNVNVGTCVTIFDCSEVQQCIGRNLEVGHFITVNCLYSEVLKWNVGSGGIWMAATQVIVLNSSVFICILTHSSRKLVWVLSKSQWFIVVTSYILENHELIYYLRSGIYGLTTKKYLHSRIHVLCIVLVCCQRTVHCTVPL